LFSIKQVQIQKGNAQIDKRIATAILRAVVERGSFAVRYSDVCGQLRALAAGEELYGLENKMHEAVSEGLLRGVCKFPGPCGGSGCDVVVVSPEQLSREALGVIEHIVSLYQFRPYDGTGKRAEVDAVVHNFVKMQTSGCLEVASPAKAVYELAKAYGLAVREEAQLDAYGVGKVVYKIEGLGKPVAKELFYCRRCLSFPDDEDFTERCRTWRFA
jgi:hypothetical protein